jgi:hypothetical protein
VTASGGQGTTRTRHALGLTPGQARIIYVMYGIPDRLDCFYKGVLVASTGGLVSGTGTLQWTCAPASGDPLGAMSQNRRTTTPWDDHPMAT